MIVNKLKKFLSFILSFFIFLNSNLTLIAFADDFDYDKYLKEHCQERNSKGNYFDEQCAELEAEQILMQGKDDYVVMKNLGPKANQAIYYFNFRALDKIIEEIGLDKLEDELDEQMDALTKRSDKTFKPMKVLSKIGISSLIGVLGSQVVLSVSKAYKSKKDKHKQNKSISNAILTGGAATIYFTGAAIGGLLSAIYQKIKFDYFSDKINQIWVEKDKITKLNKNKAFALKLMLDYINDKDFMQGEDCFYVHENPYREWDCNPVNLGLNYTDEEKAEFLQKFEKLKKDVEENLGHRRRKN